MKLFGIKPPASFRTKPMATLALLAVPLAAVCSSEHLEAPVNAGLWPNSVPVAVQRQNAKEAPAGTISMELLRYPLPRKAVPMLKKALQMSEAGDHAGAIDQLQKTLAKYPASCAYVYSLVGAEYLKVDKIPEAVEALGWAVTLLPHDASNHANLAYALIASGEFERAEPELQRALHLDPQYKMARQLLTALELNKSASK